MQLQIRKAGVQDHPGLEALVLESFESVTWARTLDERYGPLNGLDWRERWRLRLQKVFAEQIVLVGEAEGISAAMSSSTLDRQAALAYIDILAVSRSQQGHGYGREMLRGTMDHVRELGAKFVNLDCLTTNDGANALYQAEGFEEVARHIRWFRKI